MTAKNEQIQVSGIVLTTDDGREVRLTVEQAKSLHAQLDELFGSKVQYVPTQPVYIERYRWPRPWWPYQPRITWGDTTGTISLRDNDAGMTVSYECRSAS